MNKRTPSVEWTIAESDAEWEHLQAVPLAERAPDTQHQRLHRRLWSVAALLLLVVSTGGWLWHNHRATLAQLDAGASGQRGVAKSGLPDQMATDGSHPVAPGSSDLLTVIQTNAPAVHVDIAVSRIEFHGNRAVVNIVTTAQQGAQAYRQTRFYRHTSTAWLQTEPDAALWGPERSLETPSFVYHFRQNDAQAVIAVAAQIEAIYTTLRQHFALSLTPAADRLAIDVSVTQSPGSARFEPHNYERFGRVDRLVVPSPAVYLAPVELTDADLLAQSIALPLIEQALAQANERHAIGKAWQPMLSGLRLWQLWDLELPLADRHQEIVKWIYRDLPAASPRQPVALPAHYEELCATYQLWMPSPALLDIPLACSELDRDVSFFSTLEPRTPLTRLDQLGLPVRLVAHGTHISYLAQVQLPTRPVALATLIEYTVATYGRERLPLFLVGLGQYESWESLLPAVYGVSATEFEVGWQAYLKAHYGIISAN